MQRLFPLFVLILALALSLALPPVVANAHCSGNAHAPAASARSHDHAMMHHHRDHQGKEKTDKKAADCLLRCLASCAGVTAQGPSDNIVLAFVPLRTRLAASASGEGLQLRPLVPPPQPAFI